MNFNLHLCQLTTNPIASYHILSKATLLTLLGAFLKTVTSDRLSEVTFFFMGFAEIYSNNFSKSFLL